jgi:hypothetical protein
MTDLLNIRNAIRDFLNTKQPLMAIWMNKKVQTETECTCRLTKGHRIRVVNKKLSDVGEKAPATHVIVACSGTTTSDLEIEIEDLVNHKKSKILV